MRYAVAQLRLAPLDALITRHLLIAVRKARGQVREYPGDVLQAAAGTRKGERRFDKALEEPPTLRPEDSPPRLASRAFGAARRSPLRDAQDFCRLCARWHCPWRVCAVTREDRPAAAYRWLGVMIAAGCRCPAFRIRRLHGLGKGLPS